MNINKNTLFGALILILIVAGAYFVFANNSNVNANVINTGTGSANAQIVKMHVEGSQYVFEPSTVKKGIPVRIEADISRMPGCSKSVGVSAFNVRKTLSSKDNVIEFTPNKAGTFNIACSMNMYKGTLTVLESDGSKANYIEQANTAAHSCGAGGGGCGCGGGI